MSALTLGYAHERNPLECVLEQALAYGANLATAPTTADFAYNPRETEAFWPDVQLALQALADEGPTPAVLTQVLHSLWEDEHELWSWLLLSEPPELDGLTPIQAVRAGRVADLKVLFRYKGDGYEL